MLIKCPDCGRAVSDSATACPNCGYPVAEHKKELEPVPTAAEHPAPAPAPVMERYAEPEHPPLGCVIAAAILGTLFTFLAMYMAGAYMAIGIDWQLAASRWAILATALVWTGLLVHKRGIVLAAAIVYTIAAVMIFKLIFLSLPTLICAYIGAHRMRYEKR